MSLPAGVADGRRRLVPRSGPGLHRRIAPCEVPNGALINPVSKGDLVSLTGKIATVNGCEKILMPLNPNVLAHNHPFTALFATHKSLAGPPSTSGLSVTTTAGSWTTATGRISTSGREQMFGVCVRSKIKVHGESPDRATS